MKNSKNNIKQFLQDAKAVSPAIATLILIVVAAVAAAGIGILVSHSQGSSKEMLDTKTASVQGKINIDGSTTVLPITLLAGPAFMADNPSYSVSAQGGGSNVGMLDIYTKKVDIGASSSKWDTKPFTLNGITVPDRATAIIQEAGPQATIWETPIGTGLIVLAGNVENGTGGSVATINIVPATDAFGVDANGKAFLNLSFASVQNMFRDGSVTVADSGVNVVLSAVQRSDPSGTEDVFSSWLSKDGKDANFKDQTTLQLPDTFKAFGAQGNQGIRDYISNYKVTNTAGVIGFVDIGFSGSNVNGAPNVLAANMVDAAGSEVPANLANKGVGKTYDQASKNVNGGSKGLARDLYYYSYGIPTGAVKAYLDYIVSPAGQDAVHNAGFFSI